MSLAAVIERSKKDRESWKYTSLAPLEAQKFVRTMKNGNVICSSEGPVEFPSIFLSAAERHQVVFVNGVWQSGLGVGKLPPGATFSDENYDFVLKLDDQSCFAIAPIEFIFLTTSNAEASECSANIRVDLGASGRLTLIEHHIQDWGGRPTVAVYNTEIHLGPQAKLVHGKIVDIGETASSLAHSDVVIEEGAYYDNFTLVKSGKLVRNEIEAKLAGKLAQCALNAVMLLRGASHADTTTHIIHQAPHGSSRQICKSVVAEKAHGVFQGQITVAEQAQKTDAQQLSRALLLSDQAEMDAKPELKIYADDVKCAHGATIGALDENALFYLRARGLSEQDARALLIRGFAGEILDDIHMPTWRDYARRQVEAWCDEQN